MRMIGMIGMVGMIGMIGMIGMGRGFGKNASVGPYTFIQEPSDSLETEFAL
jgi:hypothetical protein